MDSMGKIIIDNKCQNKAGLENIKQIEQYNIANSPRTTADKQSFSFADGNFFPER